MTLRDLISRFFAPRERRTTLVRNDRYELYYNGAADAFLEFRPAPDALLVSHALSEAEHDRWMREGPAFVQQLYEQVKSEYPPETAIRLEPTVMTQLEHDFPAASRERAARHLLLYNAAQPEARRVQLALLRLANGDLHELKRHVRNALVDYRDVLHEVGDVDDGEPLPEGATGIDLASGSIITNVMEIDPETLPFELIEAGLADEVADDVVEPIIVPLTRPLELGGVVFNVALVYEHEGIAEAHLTPTDGSDPTGWLRAHAGNDHRAFSWGKVDLLPEAGAPATIAIRYWH